MALAMEGNRMGKDGASGSQSKFDQEYADRVAPQHVDNDRSNDDDNSPQRQVHGVSDKQHLGS